MRAVKQLTRYSSRTGRSKTMVFEVVIQLHPYYYSLKTSTRCRWALFSYHSVDIRNILYARRRIQSLQELLLRTLNPHATCERGYQICACIFGPMIMDLYFIYDRLIYQGYIYYLESILPGCLKICLLWASSCGLITIKLHLLVGMSCPCWDDLSR
jgi:hypothetical protein